MSNVPTDEQVALVDESGVVVGEGPRSLVRAQNLRHIATGVLVRDTYGLIYVHRRTDTKDVFPGAYDCVAGGVVLAGETPEAAAERELAEELGVSGVPLRPLLTADYADEHTRYVAHVYETTWNGPIAHQPEEVASGSWMTLEDLLRRLENPDWLFVPDTRQLIEQVLAGLARDRVLIETGWDSRAWLVEGTWLDREPRRPEVADRLRTEACVLPWLAPQLPLPLPTPRIMSEHPLRLRHRLIVGTPCNGSRAVHGHAVGSFLGALHAVSAADVRAMGVMEWELVDTWPRFEHEVLPMIEPDLGEAAEQLLRRCENAPRTALVHADLGPDHILVDGDLVTGIIDWTDSCIGDPALDLSWVLFGTEPAFSGAVRAAYDPADTVVLRARDWHLLGPWHQVTYGIDLDDPAHVRSGLDGVNQRLRASIGS